MKKILVFILFLNTFCLIPYSRIYSAGETGGMPGYFLDMGIGARALGMGRSFVAVADDVSALYWNPAGLSRLNYIEISLTHISLFEDTRYDNIGFAKPWRFWNKDMVYGLAIAQQYTGGIVERDENNVPGSTINDQSFALIASNSYLVNKKLAVGKSIKVVNKRFAGQNKVWSGVNISALYSVFDFLDAGLNMQNVVKTTFKRSGGGNYVVPITAKLGVAAKLLNKNLIISADIESTSNYATKLHSGIEWYYRKLLKFRAGYDNRDVTYGLGLSDKNYQVDYAILNHDLGLSHRATFTYRFGSNVPEDSKLKIKDYEVAVNTMKEIPAGIYNLFSNRNISVISVKIKNNTNKESKFRISYRLGVKDKEEYKEVVVPGKQTGNFDFIPTLTQDDIRVIEVIPTPSAIFVEVSQITKKDKMISILRDSYPAVFLPYDQFSPQTTDAKDETYNLMDTLASWVTFNDRSLGDVISKASDKGAALEPPVKIVGFQPPNVFSKIERDYRSLEERDKDYMSQIKLIYDTLKEDYKMMYINQPIAYRNSQRIKFPYDTLKNKGNCIELAVLFASLLESIEIEPILAIFTQDEHVAVGWKVSGEGREICNLLETNVFGEDFEKAVSKGKKLVEDNGIQQEFANGIPFDENGVYKKEPNVIMFDIKKMRAKIPPSPYVNR